jgi:hypothetical protein
MAPDDPCLAAGIHFADVVIADAKDPQQRGIMEQERSQIVNRTAHACQTLSWDEHTRACIQAANTTPELQKCEREAARKTSPR